MKNIREKLEFEFIFFFFCHWQKLIPANINYCRNGGMFGMLQNILLRVLHITQYWPERTMARFTERRIRYLLRRTAGERLYLPTELDRRHPLRDFSRLPVIAREELRQRFRDAINAHARRGSHSKLLIGATSGTTGVPMRVAFTEKAAVQYRILRNRLFGFGGLKPEEEFIYPRTTPNPHYCSKNVFLAHDLEAMVDSCEALFRRMRENNIVAIFAFPSFLTLVAERMQRDRVTPPPIKAIFSAGEDLSPAMRARIEKAFQARVYNHYATVDLATIGQECEYQRGIHINPEFHFLEILAPDGTPLGPDQWGRIVITQPDPALVPIIRYETGDIGMLLSGSCECGRTLPRIMIRGRASEVISTGKEVISPLAFKEIIDAYDPAYERVRQYQVILAEDARLRLLLVPTERFIPEDAADIDRICKKFLRGRIEFALDVVHDVEHIGLKTPLFIRRKPILSHADSARLPS